MVVSAVVEIITTIGSIKRMRRGGEEGDKERSENSRGILQTRSKEVCVCARGFFSFFPFFFPRIPLRIRAKAALYFYVYLFRIGGASVLTRKQGKSNGCARSQRKGNKLVE